MKSGAPAAAMRALRSAKRALLCVQVAEGNTAQGGCSASRRALLTPVPLPAPLVPHKGTPLVRSGTCRWRPSTTEEHTQVGPSPQLALASSQPTVHCADCACRLTPGMAPPPLLAPSLLLKPSTPFPATAFLPPLCSRHRVRRELPRQLLESEVLGGAAAEERERQHR